MIDIANSIDWSATGFRIEATYDKSREALKDIIAKNPTVVITDIKMPGMDGFELIAECKKANVQSEFVIVSSYSDFCYAKQAIQNAVVDYCLKPINPDALKELLAKIFARLDNSTDVAENSSDFSCILDYVKENYHRQITLTEISQAFSFHRNYICFLFKKNLNLSFHHYLNNLRIVKAKNLLTHTTLSIEEVAQQIGLEYFHFCKFFKKETQETPTAYRKQNAKRNS